MVDKNDLEEDLSIEINNIFKGTITKQNKMEIILEKINCYGLSALFMINDYCDQLDFEKSDMIYIDKMLCLVKRIILCYYAIKEKLPKKKAEVFRKEYLVRIENILSLKIAFEGEKVMLENVKKYSDEKNNKFDDIYIIVVNEYISLIADIYYKEIERDVQNIYNRLEKIGLSLKELKVSRAHHQEKIFQTLLESFKNMSEAVNAISEGKRLSISDEIPKPNFKITGKNDYNPLEKYVLNQKVLPKEGTCLEYKAWALPLPDDLKVKMFETILAFLNTNGGRFIIGVEDDLNVIGVKMTKKNMDEFSNILDIFKKKIETYVDERVIKVIYLPVYEKKENGTKEGVLQERKGIHIIEIIVWRGKRNKVYNIEQRDRLEIIKRDQVSNRKLTSKNIIEYLQEIRAKKDEDMEEYEKENRKNYPDVDVILKYD